MVHAQSAQREGSSSQVEKTAHLDCLRKQSALDRAANLAPYRHFPVRQVVGTLLYCLTVFDSAPPAALVIVRHRLALRSGSRPHLEQRVRLMSLVEVHLVTVLVAAERKR